MISLHFEKEQDCIVFFSKVAQYLSFCETLGFRGHFRCYNNEVITIGYEDHIHFNESLRPLIASIFTEYVLATKEEKWLCDIVSDMFYFQEVEEQQQIVSIARSLLNHERNIGRTNVHFQREDFIYSAFLHSLEHDATLYFEAFLTFRLREYFDQLIDYVEKAIDEYFLEQEYQTIIEQLRQFILHSKEKNEIVHVLYDEDIRFYDEALRHIQTEQLLQCLKEELVFEKGLQIEEMIVSPLVSLVPKKVIVYTNHFDAGVVHTLQAIFQERLTLMPLDRFYLREATERYT